MTHARIVTGINVSVRMLLLSPVCNGAVWAVWSLFGLIIEVTGCFSRAVKYPKSESLLKVGGGRVCSRFPRRQTEEKC